MLTLVSPNININFMGKKNLLMTLSAFLLIIAMVPIIVRGGVNYGIDFAGGVLVQIKFAKATEPIAIKHALKLVALDDSLVQSFGKIEENEFLIRVQKPDLILEGLNEKITQALINDYGNNSFEVRRVETVGPKAGKDLREKALLAIFFSLLLIAVYISGRFEDKWLLSGIMAIVLAGISLGEYWLLTDVIGLEDSIIKMLLIITCLFVTILACWVLRLRYAMGAVVSLIHDVLITIGIFTMLGREFNLSTVAAVLTIIGYSINDTIIVYDRLRENLLKDSKKNIEKVLNDSINQTLSRTILTVGTVLLVLISLYILGGSVIEEFALVLLIGTVAGTYSSVYVASPMIILVPAISSNVTLSNLNRRSASSPTVNLEQSFSTVEGKFNTKTEKVVTRKVSKRVIRNKRKRH